MNELHQMVEEDFEAAKTGSGSRNLAPEEALELLDYCARRNWAFQSVEAFVVDQGRERLDLGKSLIGLEAQEESASFLDTYEIAQKKIMSALESSRHYIFKVWITPGEDL
jgi:hypothetical protein